MNLPRVRLAFNLLVDFLSISWVLLVSIDLLSRSSGTSLSLPIPAWVFLLMGIAAAFSFIRLRSK